MDKLGLYNGALRLCGERILASVSENREPRRLLDNEYDGALKYCLEKGLWLFATRTVRLESDPDYAPEFGYQYVFLKPEDYVNTAAVCQDEYFDVPLTRYEDEGQVWVADVDPLYVRYISNDVEYGMNLNKWPESFVQFVQAYLASQIVVALTHSDSKANAVEKRLKDAVKTALARDAMKQPVRFLPQNNWSRARASSNNGERAIRNEPWSS